MLANFRHPSADECVEHKRIRFFYAELQRGQFHLHYQPVVSTQALQPLYGEGLLRYCNSVLGFNPFSLLEDYGVMRHLDHCVVQHLIATLQANPGLHLGCNISAQSAAFDEGWERTLATLTAAPQLAARLIIEITESTAFSNIAHAVDFVRRLQGVGCRVAVDDFGSGFGTLEFIQKCQPDIIKVDQGYVRRARDQALSEKTLEHLVGLCRTLAPVVVVEGIETIGDHALVLRAGGEWGQGYLFGHPSATPDGLADNLPIAG
ncbi:MAG: EAL domain-containing protein [Gammaproteobacteria bacterium]|nr:EAL domain-containing protein [Gammaproteobacteria bacterium]MBU1489694.1 EAL domain-containing protein [Gammaproteobacteria bacterium]MBU2140733.1 EAL domain-containing protein [Gammaproteobacteria bacterium]MBU2215642.1 EAL domain-containing protein [Gammaproteobacteria bacterium]MBU2324948.1 EAL domain-containing protein [Gammaproteobacteria bacterium]